MASRDLKPDGSDLPRSLSEQLRILEQQLSRLSDGAPVGLVHPQQQRLPTSLGRPIALASPVLGVPVRDEDEDEPAALAASRERRTFRRRAVIGGSSLLLLAASAVVPSLIWQPSLPEATVRPPPPVVVLRTGQFADAARELGHARIVEPAPAETASPAQAPMPERPAAQSPDHPTGVRPLTTLTVPESELPRLGLPMLVSGGGPSWAGSAVIIDGLPAEARVSHGMKIAPDTWTVGMADVSHAVLSLPHTTPDQLELSVRVLAANSHELAASALRLHVVRTPERPAMIAPAAIFEPAAAETGAGPEIDPMPTPRQAVKVERPKRPANPAKPPVTQQAKQPDRPTATSGWVSELRPASPQVNLAPMPSWAPFSNR